MRGALIALAALVALAGLLSASALPTDWTVVDNDPEWTNVNAANRIWRFEPNPERVVGNGWMLAVRRPRNPQQNPTDRPTFTIERKTISVGNQEGPVQATKVAVRFMGSQIDARNRPRAELVVSVHCITELPGAEWAEIGSVESHGMLTAHSEEFEITQQDCASQTVDAVRVQILGATRKRDFRFRIVYLTGYQLYDGPGVINEDDFTRR
jgi:hypothetical protein